MLTDLLQRLSEPQLRFLMRVMRLAEDGVVEYFHDLFCPCNAELEDGHDAAA